MRRCTDNIDSCRCRCYGCMHHCGAHWPMWMRAAVWVQVHLGLRR